MSPIIVKYIITLIVNNFPAVSGHNPTRSDLIQLPVLSRIIYGAHTFSTTLYNADDASFLFPGLPSALRSFNQSATDSYN